MSEAVAIPEAVAAGPTGGGAAEEKAPSPSRFLQYLPGIYQDNEFLGRFLRIFEDLLQHDEQVLAHPEAYYDPRMAPSSFLPWLATWIDLALDENWPEARRRELIHRGTELYRWRGTRRGLLAYLRIYAGVEPVITEQFTKEEGGPFHFTVALKVKDAGQVDEARLRAIIEAEKPAHTTYTLQIEGPVKRPAAPAVPRPAGPTVAPPPGEVGGSAAPTVP